MHRELHLLNEQLENRVVERTEQLQASEANFRALADNANDGILITAGSGGDTVYANRRIAEMTGWSVEELLKKNMRDYIAPDTFPDEIKLYSQILEGMPCPNHCEVTISQKNGAAIPVEMTISRTLWHGQPAVITSVRDITERKKRDEEFIRACKLKSLSTLAGGIAHDFNNLLTGILGNASIAKTFVNPGDNLHKIMTDLENTSLRAKDLTQQLLTFAKGGAPVKKKPSLSPNCSEIQPPLS